MQVLNLQIRKSFAIVQFTAAKLDDLIILQDVPSICDHGLHTSDAVGALDVKLEAVHG